MTIISNNSSWWPVIENNVVYSYFTLASFIAVIYDWALTFGQEYELVWKQRCSLMTVLYLSVRYIGILGSTVYILSLPSVALADVGCTIVYMVSVWTCVIVNAMLGIIVIARLHAMYQQSRHMAIVLAVTLSIVQIACGVLTAISSSHVTVEELILSGNHVCISKGINHLMVSIVWILGTLWEVVTLSLAVWIAVKHFLELRRFGPSPRSTIGDCFTVLITTHVVYFASISVVSSLYIAQLSPKISHLDFAAFLTYSGILRLASTVQMFVLGPRLILSVRGYHAKLVANSGVGVAITSIVLEPVRISTGSGV